jgi:hypothetical protein
MASSKKPAKAKSRATFKDLKSTKNPRGGGTNTFVKIGGITGNSTVVDPTIKVVTPIPTTDKFT